MGALEHFPRVDTAIVTSQGRGTIQKLDIFKNRVWIQYQDGTWEDKPLDEVKEILATMIPSSDGPQASGPDKRRRSKKSRRRGGGRQGGAHTGEGGKEDG